MDHQSMQKIKDKLTKILDIIPNGSSIYYLEYPVYENIGDLLIMQGTEKFFKDNNINVIKRYSYLNFPKNSKIPKDIIIVLQGGGNFGDLYEGPQQLREHIVKSYNDNKVVILPQTIYFNNKNKQKETLSLFQKHKNLHFFVRDKRSFDEVKAYISNTYLLPDMAHQLWPITPINNPIKKTLFLSRTDGELNENINYDKKEDMDILDWPTLLSKKEHRVVRSFVRLHQLSAIIGGADIVRKLWYRYADYLITKAIKLFSNYQQIETSRLHGHILACLMNKKNIFLDNSYGKNSGYYKEWTNIVKISELKGEK